MTAVFVHHKAIVWANVVDSVFEANGYYLLIISETRIKGHATQEQIMHHYSFHCYTFVYIYI